MINSQVIDHFAGVNQQGFLKLITTQCFSLVLAFLDFKSVSLIVRANKQIRFAFGTFLKESKNEQRRYHKSISEDWNKLNPLFSKYENCLLQANILEDERQYQKFVRDIDNKNAYFYERFFSLCLNQEIQIQKQYIHYQKKGLLALKSTIFHNIKQRLSKKEVMIPNQDNPIDQVSLSESSKNMRSAPLLKKFGVNLIEISEQLKINKMIDCDFKYYSRIKKYLSLVDNSIGNQEKVEYFVQGCFKKVYYMPFRTSFFDLVTHNILPIILSFLDEKERLQTRVICKTFFNSYLRTQKIIAQQFQLILEIKESYINQHLSKELQEMIKYNQSQLITKCDLCELKSYVHFPSCGRALYEFIFSQFDEKPTNLEYRKIVYQAAIFNDKEIKLPSGMLSNCYFKELDQIKIAKIEELKSQYSLSQMKNVSKTFGIIYTNIIINYHLQLSKVSLEVYQQLIKNILWVEKMSLSVRKMDKIINHFQEKQQQAPSQE